MIILQRKPFKTETKIITKYRIIISSCYFAQLRIIFASIEKYEIKFLKNYSSRGLCGVCVCKEVIVTVCVCVCSLE